LDHFVELLRAAITRAQKEQPTEKYFWAYEKRLDELEQTPICKEINAYRNHSHEISAIIGCKWEKKGGQIPATILAEYRRTGTERFH
jgi:hypothetical protein